MPSTQPPACHHAHAASETHIPFPPLLLDGSNPFLNRKITPQVLDASGEHPMSFHYFPAFYLEPSPPTKVPYGTSHPQAKGHDPEAKGHDCRPIAHVSQAKACLCVVTEMNGADSTCVVDMERDGAETPTLDVESSSMCKATNPHKMTAAASGMEMNSVK
mgnify:FL=1